MAKPLFKFEFSDHYEAKRSRIRRLPRMVVPIADTHAKNRAVNLIETFRKGIRSDTFGLRRLKPETIKRKSRRGLSKPTTPLYALGDQEKRSYINMMRIRKLKGRGYRVAQSHAKHHESELQLRHLFVVHEYGTVIRMRGGTIIRIPARPAFANAFRSMMLWLRNFEPPASEVRRAIVRYINTSREDLIARVSQRAPGWDDWDDIL